MSQFRIKKDPTNQFRRPALPEDMRYRRIQKATFAEKMEKLLPKEKPLCFHGTPIWNAQEILRSGNISAEIDRKGAGKDILNMSGTISVTTVADLWWTVKEFADLANFNYPAGCIFVLEPKNESEFNSAKQHKTIENVNLISDSKRLKNIITTPENLERVRGWISKSELNLDPKIVVDYDSFLKDCEKNFFKKDKELS